MGTTLPALTKMYKNKIESCKDPSNRDYLAAELLYMQVMADPVGVGMFSEGEIGDYDQDGLPEFHDGWGRPIRYLLWPAGFFADKNCESDLQLTTAFGNSKFVHDPFDTAITDKTMPALYPLIYSAGPDGIYDINYGKSGDNGNSTVQYDKNKPDPMMQSQNLYIGEPKNDTDPNSTALHHYDNITNHSMLTNSN